MIETDRVLRPLREAEPSIEQLDTYESPAVLTEALRATWHAVDRTLRTLLRSDATAPESIRMTAMSPEQMPADAVMAELRRRELVSIRLAGRVHELRQAVERADAGAVRAADADDARDVVRCVTEEVHGAARRATNASLMAAAPEPSPLPVGTGRAADDDAVAGAGTIRERVRPLLLAAVAGVVLVTAVLAVFLFGRESEMDKGIAAFADGRAAAAEQHFRAALREDDGNNTARLYLGRILRREDRYAEAADLLRTAAARAPDDAAVRRELGYLFLDLETPASAARQFRRAVELEPAEPLNWIGLVQTLTLSGDSAAAAEWLRRAPQEARAMVGNARGIR